MIKIIIAALVFTQFGLANYPYFRFDESKLRLRPDTYRKYLKPQIRNIRSEYFHISKKITPEQQYVIKLRESALKLKMKYLTLFKECKSQQKDQSYCEIDVKELLKYSYQLDNNITQVRQELIKANLSSDMIANYIEFSKNIDQVEYFNIKIQRFLELRKIVNQTLYTTYTQSFTDLSNTVNSLFTMVNFAFIDLFPERLQPIFESLLIDFITPLEERMLYNFSPNWFKSQIGHLNLTWNTFHMNMEKGQKRVPRKILKVVKIMHNRWNSILKVLL